MADGHLTPEPIENIYSGVVSLRNLRLVIFLGKLNSLELWGADIGNAYLEAFTDEKLYILAQNSKSLKDISFVGSPQVPFSMCTLEIPQKLQHKFFALNFCYLYFGAFSQTMSFSCIFVFAPSLIRMC